MRIPCSNVLISSSDLRVSLLQQKHPMQASFSLRKGSPDLVILEHCKVIIDYYLLGLAVHADIKSIDSLLVVVVSAEDVVDVAWLPSYRSQSGKEVGVVLTQPDYVTHWLLLH